MITLNFIPHKRYYYLPITFKQLKKIDAFQKKYLTINILLTDNLLSKEETKIINTSLEETSIPYKIIPGDSNYRHKLIRIFDNTNTIYSFKIDEDIFLNHFDWQHLFDNINHLENSKILLLAPIISSGIPSIETFLDQFFPQDIIKHFYSIFNQTYIPNMWGANYNCLNNRQILWDYKLFYASVSKIQHYYKGIHPIRISIKAQQELSINILNCIEKIFENRKDKIKISLNKGPYFCNSIFGIKTELWEKITMDPLLNKDAFDEVPLNLFREKESLYFAFLDYCFAYHPSYNTIGDHYKVISDNFFKILNDHY